MRRFCLRVQVLLLPWPSEDETFLSPSASTGTTLTKLRRDVSVSECKYCYYLDQAETRQFCLPVLLTLSNSPTLVQARSICWSLSGDGLMDLTGNLGLRSWSSPAPHWYDTIRYKPCPSWDETLLCVVVLNVVCHTSQAAHWLADTRTVHTTWCKK